MLQQPVSMNLLIFAAPPRSTYRSKSLLIEREKERGNSKYANIPTITGKQEKKILCNNREGHFQEKNQQK